MKTLNLWDLLSELDETKEKNAILLNKIADLKIKLKNYPELLILIENTDRSN